MKQILIVQTAFLGDLLLTIPLIKNLRRIQPEAEIHFICRKGLGEILKDLKLLDYVYEIDKKNPKEFKTIKQDLKNINWDWIICPHESFRSKLIVWPLKSKIKTSYKNFLSSFFFNDIVERPLHYPEVLRSLSLILKYDDSLKQKFMDFEKEHDRIYSENFQITESQKEQLKLQFTKQKFSTYKFRKFSEDMSLDCFTKNKSLNFSFLKKTESKIKKDLVLLAPGSVWATKQWNKESFQSLIQKLKKDFDIGLIGSADEFDLCEEIRESNSNIQNWAGKLSLWESAQLISLAKFVVTNDSGAMHLASLSSTSCISIFGPTVLNQGYRPWNPNAISVDVELECRPCGKHGSKKCPIETHACMKLVQSELVMKQIERFILSKTP